MKKVVLLFILIGLSFILIGSGVELQGKSVKKESKKILFYTDNISSKDYETAKINLNQIKESTEKKVEEKPVEEVPVEVVPVRNWYNPTNNGYISNSMGFRDRDFHFGYDITSPLGTREVIYTIADGVISGIFYDNAGALIVTVNHNINGQDYTSMYVHLSAFARGIKSGMTVTKDTPLGFMGQTGNATGVHLHLEVADCALFSPSDNNCSSISGYYNYLRRRFREGFRGAQTVVNLPQSWSSR